MVLKFALLPSVKKRKKKLIPITTESNSCKTVFTDYIFSLD